jgi:L-lysine 2,3-aminomutase
MLTELHCDHEQSTDEATWQHRLKRAFRTGDELAQYLELDWVPRGIEEDFGFALFCTREFASRIRKNDWNDPLLKQVWPDQQESQQVDGFVKDAVGELSTEVVPGLLHKYAGRVLLITTGACAIHCRYCFRRHYPYSEAPKSVHLWQPALDYIQADSSINEVILSGGDPLMIRDRVLASLVEKIEAIPHVDQLRIHTRLPIVLPQRVDEQLTAWLHGTRLSTWIVIHCNHAQEIDAEVRDSLQRLRMAGAVLLNQAVLLRGINADVDLQESLAHELIKNGVVPYYLHQLDPVAGAAHFEPEIAAGQTIIEQLRTRLPGFAVPRLVREVAGQPHKIVEA